MKTQTLSKMLAGLGLAALVAGAGITTASAANTLDANAGVQKGCGKGSCGGDKSGDDKSGDDKSGGDKSCGKGGCGKGSCG